MKVFCIGFLTFFIMHAALGQQQYTFTQYNEENGLPNGTILNIFRDSTGYLWLCMEQGVARFDGYDFKVFSHNPDDSTSLPTYGAWEGKQLVTGDIVFKGNQNPSVYNPKTLSFTTTSPYMGYGLPLRTFRMKNEKDTYYILSPDSLGRISRTKRISSTPLPGQHPRMNLNMATDSISLIFLTMIYDVYRFYPEDNRFEKLDMKDQAGLQDSVLDISYDDEENRFTLIGKKHLYHYDVIQNRFIPFYDLLPAFQNARNSLMLGSMGALGKNPYQDIYIAPTRDGELYRINLHNGEEKLIRLNQKLPPEEAKDKSFGNFAKDKNGWLWIGGGMGLFHYNVRTDEFHQFIHEPGNPQSLPTNHITNVRCDQNGVVFVGCHGQGLVKMEELNPAMEKVIPMAGKTQVSLSGDSRNIRTFLETDRGYMIGSLRGLFEYDKTNNAFHELTQLVPSIDQYTGIVGTLGRDRHGNIWIGTWQDYFVVYNPETKQYIHHNMNDPGSMVIWRFRDFYCDSRNKMWLTTQGQGTFTVDLNTINFNNPSSLKLQPIQIDPVNSNEKSIETIFNLVEDNDGTIWAASNKGLLHYDPSTQKWNLFEKIPGDKTSLQNNDVRALVFDNKGDLWMGTTLGGLNRFNKKDQTFRHFTMEDGLPSNDIYTLLLDDKGMLWMGTRYGICRFNPNDFSITNFTLKDGIQNYEFNTEAALKLKDGTLLFGGVDGYNIIDPEKIESNKAAPPPVVITSIKIFDREVPPGDGHLILKHTQNSLSFEFAALSFYRNQDHRYAYKMENVDPDWVFSNSRRFVSYPKLEPGEYTFKVKAANSDGVWNETGTQFTITITPPWWATWWARGIFLLAIISGIVLFLRNRTATLRNQKIVLENTVTERTVDLLKQKELAEEQRMRAEHSEQIKKQFLANMSHEIRTPMNAVMGMTELVLNSPLNEKQRNYLEAVKKSSNNLLHLINDILDLSKIEAGKIELENIHFSVHELVQHLKDMLQDKARKKGLQFLTTIDPNIPVVLIGDPARLTQVLVNLVSNAIKFTEKGSVWIDLTQEGDHAVRFSIADTGIGIPANKLDSIFESFSQAHASDSRKYGGTGLGLTISKQFIELMGGALHVESEVNSGSTFSFTLPLQEGSAEKLKQQSFSEELDASVLDGLRILLVDDSADNRIVARDLLLSKTKVIIEEATNGKEAIDLLSQNDYDIVLMDVQMPLMDGYQATQEIRSPLSTVRNHLIPVIALTASVIRSDLDKCRASGMNDYVPKPFRLGQLILTIARLSGRDLKSNGEGRGEG